VIRVALEDLFLLADDEDHGLVRVEVLLGDAEDVVLGDGLDAGPPLRPVLRVLGEAAGELIGGELAGDLGLGVEVAREGIHERSLGGVEFLVGDGRVRDAVHLVEDDARGVGDGAGLGGEAGLEGPGVVDAAGE